MEASPAPAPVGAGRGSWGPPLAVVGVVALAALVAGVARTRRDRWAVAELVASVAAPPRRAPETGGGGPATDGGGRTTGGGGRTTGGGGRTTAPSPEPRPPTPEPRPPTTEPPPPTTEPPPPTTEPPPPPPELRPPTPEPPPPSPAPSPPSVASPAPGVFTFRRDDVLGTSFQLTVLAATEADAARAERVVLDAIERLRLVFSGWDPASEVSRLNARPWAERRDVEVSEPLGTVLKLALRWRGRSSGAFDGYLGELHDLWRAAAARGEPPPPDALAAHAAAARAGPGFGVVRRKVDALRSAYLVTCDRAGRFDLDGLAKGWIVDQALAALTREGPPTQGALLEVGGDLRVVGSSRADLAGAPWEVDVADPRRTADNAPPLARLALRDQAVASSGGYARRLDVGARRGSHIFDPRTAAPAEGVLGATAVAADLAAADALATALCVLEPAAGVRLADAERAACAIVDRAGVVHTSRAWADLLADRPVQTWPAGWRVEVTLRLRDGTTADGAPGRGFKRHGTAVWVEDARGKRVRLLALWFDRGELKYLKDLEAFWNEGWLGSGGSSSTSALRTWTRASRAPGRYTLEWDGLDDAGQPVQQGRYRVRVNINREKGPPNGQEVDTVATVEVECRGEAARAAAPDQPELADVTATFGPPEGR